VDSGVCGFGAGTLGDPGAGVLGARKVAFGRMPLGGVQQNHGFIVGKMNYYEIINDGLMNNSRIMKNDIG